MFSLLSAGIFFIANIKIDGRALIPVFISTFIIIVLFIKRLLDYFRDRRVARFVIFIFCEIFVLFSLITIIFGIKGFYEEGQGYNSRKWLESDTISELRSMDITETIYTNNPYAIYFFLDRNPSPFPTKINIYTNKNNINYIEDLNRTIEEIREKNGLIVLFDLRQYYLVQEKELIDDYELILVKDTRDGSIYRVK